MCGKRLTLEYSLRIRVRGSARRVGANIGTFAVEAKPRYKLKGQGRALPFLLWQGYVSVNTRGKPVTDEQIKAAFLKKYDYEPKVIKRNGGGILAGPVVEG